MSDDDTMVADWTPDPEVLRSVTAYLVTAPEQGEWPWQTHCEGLAGGILHALHEQGIEAAPALLAEVAALRDDRSRLQEAFQLAPCHVTGEHTPDHHLTREAPCSFQLAELALRVIGVLGEPPHRDHAGCVWCDEYGKGWPDQEGQDDG